MRDARSLPAKSTRTTFELRAMIVPFAPPAPPPPAAPCAAAPFPAGDPCVAPTGMSCWDTYTVKTAWDRELVLFIKVLATLRLRLPSSSICVTLSYDTNSRRVRFSTYAPDWTNTTGEVVAVVGWV